VPGFIEPAPALGLAARFGQPLLFACCSVPRYIEAVRP